MTQTGFDELVADFDFLDDWEDRYRHIIEIGKAMPVMQEALKSESSKVHGCASQVWLVPSFADGKLGFVGDSDALIVRGLIAVLKLLFEGRSAADIVGVDARAELARLGLDQALSAQRSNGLRAMVARLQQYAQTHL